MKGAQKHWAEQQERGGQFWLALMVGLYRVGGRALFRGVLVFVIAWYWLLAPRARRASLDYLRTLHRHAGAQSPFAATPGALQSYRHFLQFGDSVLDKLAGWMGEIPEGELVVHGREHLQALRGKGALLVGSHFGNLELLRAAKSGQPQPVNVLVHTRHAESFNRFMQRLNPAAGVRLHQISELGPDSAIVLQEKLEKGEWLVLTGDRLPPQSARAQRADFLGRDAALPEGPWLLGSLLRCPVLLLFCYRVEGRYEVHIQPFRERVQLPRGARAEALQGLCGEYADALAGHCRRAPYQWFNFYDFWTPAS